MRPVEQQRTKAFRKTYHLDSLWQSCIVCCVCVRCQGRLADRTRAADKGRIRRTVVASLRGRADGTRLGPGLIRTSTSESARLLLYHLVTA